MGCKASAKNAKATSPLTNDVKMHHCIISVCLLFLHCITAKQRLSFLSLSLSCLAMCATTQNHTHRHTHPLSLSLLSQSSSTNTLRTDIQPALCDEEEDCAGIVPHTSFSLPCVVLPLFLSEWQGRSVSQSVSLSVQSGVTIKGGQALTGTLVSLNSLGLETGSEPVQ